MKLNDISDNKRARYKFKRVGRGIGSGKGNFLTIAGARTTVIEAYDILVGLTFIANLIPYFYLFAALIRLTRDDAPRSQPRRRQDDGWDCGWLPPVASRRRPSPSCSRSCRRGGTGNVVNYEANLVLQTAAVLVTGLAVYGWARRRRVQV